MLYYFTSAMFHAEPRAEPEKVLNYRNLVRYPVDYRGTGMILLLSKTGTVLCECADGRAKLKNSKRSLEN